MTHPVLNLRAVNSSLLAQQTCHCEATGKTIAVFQQGDIYWISVDGETVQSAMSINSPAQLTLSYLEVMASALLYTPNKATVLNLGLGGGALVRFMDHHFPDCHIDSVEHCGHMVELARQHFQLPAQHQVFIEDAARYLAADHNSYDLIFADLPLAVLAQNTFLHDCRRRLKNRGLVTFNLFFQNQQQLLPALRGIRSIFKTVIVLAVPEHPNLIVLAGNGELNRVQNSDQLKRLTGLPFDLLLKQRIPLPDALVNNHASG